MYFCFADLGQNPGIVDYMIWPWMERLPSLPILSQGLLKVQLEKFPKVVCLLCWGACIEVFTIYKTILFLFVNMNRKNGLVI